MALAFYIAMSIATASLAIVGASTAALVLDHERQATLAAERLAAAALETLLNAIDANDAQTGAHVRRVASYALLLAEAADVTADELRLIEQVALFHDIGKIHEALFDIIHGDSKPTPAERRAILTHPQRGADVLAPLQGFYPNLPDGVLSHHERWDGKGYPRKLKGAAIPLSARIVAVADTFDAVTFQRRYSAGRSASEGRDIILVGRATQFDPELVDLFVCPPIFERVETMSREVAGWHSPMRKRRQRIHKIDIPEITFRWRPGSSGADGRHARGRALQKAR